jgi:hypothetical protein|tara:strand:- start:380 stop:907 length:528 start_codon:yes stop_codon:yes gene_type:complete
MKCFHGTTKKGLNAILNSDGYKPNSPWTVSDNDGAMYVWPENKLAEQYDFEDIEQMIYHAFESAEIQAVVEDSTEIFVLEMEIPDQILEDDHSCDNMANIASFINMNDFSKNMIVNIYKTTLNKWNAPFIVANLLSNPNFNQWCLEEDLLSLAETLQNSDFYRDPTEFDFELYKL